MKKLLILFCVVAINQVNAQIVGEIFTTRKYTSQDIWWSKSLNDSTRFSFFSYNRLRIDHQNQNNNELLNYSTFNYDLGKGLGISAGQLLTNQGFSPIIALNYFYANETWLVNLFPGIEIKNNANADIFTFIQFKPKLTDKVRLFTQFIGNITFNIRQHKFSEQSLRVGLSVNTFQFGVGLDTRQVTVKELNEKHYKSNESFGLFLRKEF
jgi:hypothetical protein